jgi:hypothetical protein
VPASAASEMTAAAKLKVLRAEFNIKKSSLVAMIRFDKTAPNY